MVDGEFTTKEKIRKPIPFVLDGEDYLFTPPKKAGTFLALLNGEDELKAIFDWIGEGLPEEQNDRLIARLKDPKDDFDVDDLKPVMNYLLAKSGVGKAKKGRPTT